MLTLQDKLKQWLGKLFLRQSSTGTEIEVVSGGRTPTTWQDRLNKDLTNPDRRLESALSYAAANIQAIRTTLSGLGPDDIATGSLSSSEPNSAGCCMAVNISAAHIPAVCRASREGDPRPYKNGYDLGKYRVGDSPPQGTPKLREVVDNALPLPADKLPSDVYFGALELNGPGIYFYGDICLVLKSVDSETVLLERNSYDLVRAPLRAMIEEGFSREHWPERRAEFARRMSCHWGGERDFMVAKKVFEALGYRTRRFTTGQISDALLNDEDYIEVLKINSFGMTDIAEARAHAADTALEANIDDRFRSGPTPKLESLLWRERRRMAEQELREEGVSLRVITTSGRTKG